MKRIFISIILVLSLVICLPSCNTIEENPEFARFNDMVTDIYDSYKITVTTASPSGLTLTNEYKINTTNGTTKIEYRTESLNEFSSNGNGFNVPNGYKTVTEGICENANEIPSLVLYYSPTFLFSYTCIDSDIITPISFSANITSLEVFMGLDVSDATDAKFKLSYSGETITSIEVSYVTVSENTVVINYTFN